MGSSIYRFKEQVIVVLKDAVTGKVLMHRELEPNIVTNVGDSYYAQKCANSTPTYTFNKGMMVVAKSFLRAATKIASFRDFNGIATTLTGRQSFDSGYPKHNDSDTDNTGRTADAVTYKRTYTTAQANYTIKALGICRKGATSNGASTSRVLLSYKTLSAAQQVTKTSSQTLVVYVNHTFNGV
jgi:hypothetical protein